jgi:spermidine/putrescine transport system substrate-binding protein
MTRPVTRALVAFAATLALLACSDSSPPPAPAPEPAAPAAPEAPAAAPAAPAQLGGELNLFAWSEYIPQAVLDGFSKETGVQVNYETYGSNEEMLAKLMSGASSYDLIQPSEYVVEALVKEKMLIPLDKSKLPNLKNIGPEYFKQPHDPDLVYSVPYMQGTVGIVINTEKVKDPITGYADVFQPKNKGRIVILDDALEIVTWGLATLGIGPDGVTSENLAKVRPVLAAWLPLVKVYDSDSPKTALLNGDVDLGIVWSGEAAILINEQGAKFAYVLPKEGAHMFIDNIVIPKGAQNVDAAHAFIDYVLRPDVSKLISDEFPYTNPNVEARKLLTPEQQQNPASYPPGDPKLATFRDIGPMAAEVDKLFTDLKAKSGT